MTAIRSVRAAEGKFVQISNAAAQDNRLSLRARGVLLYVLSLPPEQHFTAKWLEAQVPEGREAVRSALRELERFGYFRRDRTHGADGLWAWEQVISDAPLTAEEPYDGKPSDGYPSDGKPSDKRSNTEQPKDVGPVDMASRHARAKKRASTPLTIQDAINGVRAAVTLVHGQQEANALGDEDALGLFFTYVGRRRPNDIPAYLAKIFSDAPYLDTFLSNSAPVCLTCQHWQDDCQGHAA